MSARTDTSKNLALETLSSGRAGIALLGVAALLFGAGQSSISLVNNWWFDELFALWASDPSENFVNLFKYRIAPDTNPPLYFSILHLARSLVGNDYAAVVGLNILFLATATGIALLLSRRAGLTWLCAVSAAAFVLSGPAMRFTAEGRGYLLALAVAFVSSWCVALSVHKPESRPHLLTFLMLGTIAALTHVYAALLCGTLAAGMLVLAASDARWKGLVGPSVALGLSASVVFAVWVFSLPLSSHSRIDWIEFTPQAVYNAAIYVQQLATGRRWVAWAFLLLFVIALVRSTTRPIALVFASAYAVFIALPIIVSFKQPLIFGRYWVIGAPSLIVPLAFLARDWYLEAKRSPSPRWPLLGVIGVGALAVVSGILGFNAAYKDTTSKKIWRGADIVKPLIGGCPEKSIRISNGRFTFRPGFAIAAGTSEKVFSETHEGTTRDTSAQCPVVGWVEFVGPGTTGTDAELLRFLKIDVPADEVEIRRHANGFVVLKRGAAGPS